MTVLTVGLDPTTRRFLTERGLGNEAAPVEDFELSEWLYDGCPYTAAVVNLDGGLGTYLCRGVRMRGITLAIVGLATLNPALGWGEQRATFLEQGGDDLLAQPTNPRELAASLQASIRRARGSLLAINTHYHGNFELKINMVTRTSQLDGRQLELTGSEQRLLEAFSESAGRTLSKENILAMMYTSGIDDEPEMKIIDVFVCKLRRKLREVNPGAETLIETVWGRGYRLRGHLKGEGHVNADQFS